MSLYVEYSSAKEAEENPISATLAIVPNMLLGGVAYVSVNFLFHD